MKTMDRSAAIAWLTMLFSLSACGSSGAAREPVRWILVEEPARQAIPGAIAGDGVLAPEAPMLVFRPLFKEDLSWEVVVGADDHFVEVVSITPSGEAAPGEVVTASVRVCKARTEGVYRLTISALERDVRIVGEREKIVTGRDPAQFKFTKLSGGRGGIGVAVERIR
jgi:hypothetical protein